MTFRIVPGLVALVLAFPLAAQPATVRESSVEYFTRAHAEALPRLLTDDDRLYYRSLYEAIDTQNWSRVEVLLTERPEGPLHGAALATYYLHPQSPRIELARVEAWLARYERLPQAAAMVRLGQTRGLQGSYYSPRERELVRQPGLSKRTRPASTQDGTMPAAVGEAILERITNDDPDGARLLLDGVDATLSSESRAEWRQRIAWSYYIENRDAQAFAQAESVRDGGSGPWIAEGDWVAGLSAWRLGDCGNAASAFIRSAGYATNPELVTAAHYWASRALIRCREPEKAAEQLRGAARYPETMYGMLAHEQMGRDLPGTHALPDLTPEDWRKLDREDAVRQAVMLAEIDRRDEADEILRWLTRTGDPDNFASLSRLARALGLTGAQNFMAYNAPRGASSHPSLRYPVTFRTPVGGWRVDPALAFAHSLQESNFRESVVSPAGAIGLMQIMPITRREYASSINMSSSADLKDPAVNLAFGQRTLESLGAAGYTQGKLPKVMAAYNAGPTPVARWESEVRDLDDPLLYMESLPYWETRGYVAIVMRNYWMYLRQADVAAPSRIDLAENDWPMFPRAR